MKKRTSLKDIAQKVGVSTALVSYVLNNKMEGRISKEVAQKIKETAQLLNYSTNQIARSLKTNKTYTIGLIVSDISNSFFSNLARIIEDEAEKSNYIVLFGSSDESLEKSWKLIHVLRNHQVDGIIIAPSENAEPQIRFLQEIEMPFVLIDRYFPGLKTSYVAIDNFKAAYTAVRHLTGNGLERIGIVTYHTELFHLQDRFNGYSAALRESNLPMPESWIKEVNKSNTKEDVEKAVAELLSLDQPVEAILFVSNVLSTHGLKYLNTLSIKVPDDLAIVSFDQSDVADLFYAPLTHIKQPLEEIGQMATKLLLEKMNTNDTITEVKMEAEFVIRQSTARKKIRV